MLPVPANPVKVSVCLNVWHRAIYEAPVLNKTTRKMMKCDGCLDRLQDGRQPLCVDSCPQRAIHFGPIDELRAKYGANADIAPLPSSKITHPNLVVIPPKRGGKPTGSKEGTVF